MLGSVVRSQPEEEGAREVPGCRAGWSEIVALAPTHPTPFLPCRRSPGTRAAAGPQALAYGLALCLARCRAPRAASRPKPLCRTAFPRSARPRGRDPSASATGRAHGAPPAAARPGPAEPRAHVHGAQRAALLGHPESGWGGGERVSFGLPRGSLLCR